ncbi:MAG: hypothetical protein ACI88L_000175 [Candidatus Paceibacteria bacterium]|jgi:hypothetical protein
MKYLFDSKKREVQAIVKGTQVSLLDINKAFDQFCKDFGSRKTWERKTIVRSGIDDRFGNAVMIIAMEIPQGTKVPKNYSWKKIV